MKANQLNNGNPPELPKHIIVYILAKVPSEVLYNTLRFVCKEWHRLISSSEFTYENVVHQKPGLLIQVPRWPWTVDNTWWKTSFLQIDENEFDFTLTNYSTHSTNLSKSNCNGLVLESKTEEGTSMPCVKNILTGSVLTLPSCPSGCRHEYLTCGFALGFNPGTKEYKVVHVYADSYGFELFTIGSDHKWRRIPGPFGDLNERPFDVERFSWSDPESIGGQVLHWFVESDTYIISMDLSDEKLRRTNLPDVGRSIMKYEYDLVEMNGELCFVYKVSKFQIDFWVLKDFDRQVWSKEHSIIAMSTNYTPWLASSELTKKDKDQSHGGKQKKVDDASLNRKEKKAKLPNFLKLEALATLRNGEVIVLMDKQNSIHANIMYLYDLKRKEMRQFRIKMKKGTAFQPHRSSLVSLGTDQMELSAAISNISL
ncbi:putative F-box protein At5g62060 [Herrania umbratica]|uniref:F-box protein At5g62060 n=1 Tax=Herrania umbratica TaxID=108875 RepID=A0A6J1AT85_9ROSI|nr:putative F-box protein At5g62060 [Herrania umbratica]